MERSLYSPSWYRVANLKPRLRAHVNIHRQQYRGQLWYVLQDRGSGRFHRFSPAAHYVISLMDGERSVQEIWDLGCAHLGDDVLTQEDMIRLLSQLHMSDVLYGDVPPDIAEMSERAGKQRRRKLIMNFMNPLALRVPLFDPDEFLGATLPLVRLLFSWGGALLFFVTIGYAVVQAAVHWPALTHDLTDRLLATQSLLLLVLTYPFVKVLHELGHGYAVKYWGGEVHEIGIMFLVFVPVPYVDASAASVYQDKWQRALVGAAGILVEAFLAALALFVWLNAEEGLVRAFAFNVMLIGGVSTLLFNGNPLLRYDGYYVLSDLIEIPNLGQRANRYLAYLVQHYLFGVQEVETPATARGEVPWFLFYAIASFGYRVLVIMAITTAVASRFFVIGVLIAIWALVMMVGVPLAKQLWFLLTSPVLRNHRRRAYAVTGGLVATIAIFLILVPLPYATVTEGIVWAPGEVAVHAGADGIITEVIAAPNSQVVAAAPLIQMEDPLLNAHVRVLEARVRELQLRYDERDVNDLVEAKLVGEQLKHAEADLDLARKRQQNLLVRSQTDGQFIVPRAADLPGRFVHKGDVLGYTAQLDKPVLRVIVDEDMAELVKHRARTVEVRFADRMASTMPAVIDREVPALSDSLPSMALSTMGGGEIAIDPTDPNQTKVLANLMHLELRLTVRHPVEVLGERVYIRFSYGAEPLAARLYRGLRQVFLRRFNV